MVQRRGSNSRAFTLGVVTSWLIFAGGINGSVSKADCPTLPSHPVYQGWAATIGVSYFELPSLFTAADVGKIAEAFTDWTVHNTLGLAGNCSAVIFTPGPGQFSITSVNAQDAGGPQNAARTNSNLSGGVVTSSATTFYFG